LDCRELPFLFFFYCSGDHRDLHSFPTRRSSDLDPHPKPCYLFALVGGNLASYASDFTTASGRKVDLRIYVEPGKESRCAWAMDRSEEHTSELQSRRDLVCRLLLEKKNQHTQRKT